MRGPRVAREPVRDPGRPPGRARREHATSGLHSSRLNLNRLGFDFDYFDFETSENQRCPVVARGGGSASPTASRTAALSLRPAATPATRSSTTTRTRRPPAGVRRNAFGGARRHRVRRRGEGRVLRNYTYKVTCLRETRGRRWPCVLRGPRRVRRSTTPSSSLAKSCPCLFML